ncbi:hypothetical protein E9531_15520 [Lampropedia puyangensis]|uniref:Uncharacterized protein n=1 Tax=Lampropedia puyangensis TaxID=1330072 RepID=A0A4V4GQC2_9BURK|nr:hypothetical protein [Lampropedia puyangensis]THT97705.1 hypothetical protein E9531_15520 [Lampropedia puyangensis]
MGEKNEGNGGAPADAQNGALSFACGRIERMIYPVHHRLGKHDRELARWRLSLRGEPHAFSSSVWNLAVAHHAMHEYLCEYAAGRDAELDLLMPLIKRKAAQASLLADKLLLCAQLFPVHQFELPMDQSFRFSGSLSLFQRLLLLRWRVQAVAPHDKTLHTQLVAAFKQKLEDASLLDELRRQDKLFYDKHHEVDTRLQKYLAHFERHEHPLQLMRFHLLGGMQWNENFHNILKHSDRFDAFYKLFKFSLGPTLLGHFAVIGVSRDMHLFWDVCFIVDARNKLSIGEVKLLAEKAWSQVAATEYKDYLHGSIRLHDAGLRDHLRNDDTWDKFWRGFRCQCIAPMRFMRLKVPKDFRVIKRGRVRVKN